MNDIATKLNNSICYIQGYFDRIKSESNIQESIVNSHDKLINNSLKMVDVVDNFNFLKACDISDINDILARINNLKVVFDTLGFVGYSVNSYYITCIDSVIEELEEMKEDKKKVK